MLQEKIRSLNLIREFPLGTLILPYEDQIQITYLPLMVEEIAGNEVLLGHMSKNNPLADIVHGKYLTLHFKGKDSYSSPAVETQRKVPTWNYHCVQVRGFCELNDDSQIIDKVLAQSTQYFENWNGTNWRYEAMPENQRQRFSLITTIQIQIESLKFLE